MKESAFETGTTSLPEDLKTELLRRLKDNDLELPLLPNVIWEVMELSASDDVDAAKLAKLIHHDQALAGHVLRIANSPAYMSRMPIVSLQQAISRLGTTQLCEIAFAISLQSRVFDVPGYEQEIRTLWDHAVGTAVYAKEIVETLHHKSEGDFLCGLLHDVGKPVILQTLTDLQKELGYALEPPIVTTILEAYHTWVGGHLAERWSLPPQVYESIAYHHDYQNATVYPETVMIICLADNLSYYTQLPDIFDKEGIRNHPVVASLNLRPNKTEALLSKRKAVQRIVEAMA